jgi:hypothetical protein
MPVRYNFFLNYEKYKSDLRKTTKSLLLKGTMPVSLFLLGMNRIYWYLDISLYKHRKIDEPDTGTGIELPGY